MEETAGHIQWNDQTVHLLEDTTEYTGYSKNRPRSWKYIPAEEYRRDLGGDTGLMDFALADHCSEIPCIDISRTL